MSATAVQVRAACFAELTGPCHWTYGDGVDRSDVETSGPTARRAALTTGPSNGRARSTSSVGSLLAIGSSRDTPLNLVVSEEG